MLEILKLIIGPVTAASLALFVNRLFEIRNKKVKLVFGLRKDNDIIPEHSFVKTSPSGYQLYCVNIGLVPVFIYKIIFFDKNYKKDFFLEVFPSPDNELSAIMPYSPATFSLNCQEYDNIYYFVKKTNKTDCKIIAYSIDDKKYQGVIIFWWIKAQKLII